MLLPLIPFSPSFSLPTPLGRYTSSVYYLLNNVCAGAWAPSLVSPHCAYAYLEPSRTWLVVPSVLYSAPPAVVTVVNFSLAPFMPCIILPSDGQWTFVYRRAAYRSALFCRLDTTLFFLTCLHWDPLPYTHLLTTTPPYT